MHAIKAFCGIIRKRHLVRFAYRQTFRYSPLEISVWTLLFRCFLSSILIALCMTSSTLSLIKKPLEKELAVKREKKKRLNLKLNEENNNNNDYQCWFRCEKKKTLPGLGFEPGPQWQQSVTLTVELTGNVKVEKGYIFIWLLASKSKDNAIEMSAVFGANISW